MSQMSVNKEVDYYRNAAVQSKVTNNEWGWIQEGKNIGARTCRFIWLFCEFFVMVVLQIRLRYFSNHYLKNYILYQLMPLLFAIPTILTQTSPHFFQSQGALLNWAIFIITALFYFLGLSIWAWNRIVILTKLGKEKTIKLFEIYINLAWGLNSFGFCFLLLNLKSDFKHFVITIIGNILAAFGFLVKFYAHLCVGFDSWVWRDLITNTPNEVYHQSMFFHVCDGPTYQLGYINVWGVALIAGSYQALAAAAFLHGGILAFYYWAEKPVVKEMYASSADE